MAVAVAEAHRPCPRSTGSSADRGPRSGRRTSARGAGWRGSDRGVASVVRVIPQAICGVVDRRRSAPRTARRRRRRPASPAPPSRSCGRRAAAACRSSAARAESHGAPASRTGPSDGASPTRPAGICVSPIWIRPRRKVPVVRTTAPVANRRPSARIDADDAAAVDVEVERPRPRRSSGWPARASSACTAWR